MTQNRNLYSKYLEAPIIIRHEQIGIGMSVQLLPMLMTFLKTPMLYLKKKEFLKMVFPFMKKFKMTITILVRVYLNINYIIFLKRKMGLSNTC